MLAESIFVHPVFYECYTRYHGTYNVAPVEEICEIIQKFSNQEFSFSTLQRRAKTINSWILNIKSTYAMQIQSPMAKE
jgi:hypothetical protein